MFVVVVVVVFVKVDECLCVRERERERERETDRQTDRQTDRERERERERRAHVCVCVCVYVCARARARARVCVCVCVEEGVCLTSQQHASVSQGRICSDYCTCCHTEIEAADQTFYLTQSQYTDIGPTSANADPITPGAWHGSYWSARFEVTGVTRLENSPQRKRESKPGSAALETVFLFVSRWTPLPLGQRGSRHRQRDHTSTWQYKQADNSQRERERERERTPAAT